MGLSTSITRRFFIFLLFFTVSSSAFAESPLDCKPIRNAMDFVLKDHLVYHDFNAEISARTERGFFDALMESKLFFTLNTAQTLNFYHQLNVLDPFRLVKQFEKNDCSYLFDQISTVSKAYLAVFEKLNSPEDLQKRILDMMSSGKDLKFDPKSFGKDVDDVVVRITKVLTGHAIAYKKAYSNSEQDKEISDADLATFIAKSYFRSLQRLERKLPNAAETYFLSAFAKALDPHSSYMEDEAAANFQSMIDGKFGGLGVTLEIHPFGVRIKSILPGGSAAAAGLRVGTIITQVEGQSIVGFSLDEVVSMTRGEVGTAVQFQLGYLSHGKLEALQLWQVARGEVKEASYEQISRRVVIDGKSIVIIKFSSFYSGVAQEVDDALTAEQKTAPIDGVLLDLRSNPGGLVSEAIQLVGLFIPRGAVIGLKDSAGNEEVKEDFSNYVAYRGPLAVAINEGSASASEITAGTLSDYKRAIILGSKSSYGKGTMQTVLSGPEAKIFLPHGVFKVTTNMYFTVGGVSPQSQGVSSHIEIPSEKAITDYYGKEKDQKYVLKPLEWAGPIYDWEDYKQIRNPDRLDQVKELKKLHNARVEADPIYQNYLKEGKGEGDIQLNEMLQVTKDYIELQPSK